MQMLFSFLLTENMQSLFSFGKQNEQRKRQKRQKMIHKNRTTCSEREKKRGVDLFYDCRPVNRRRPCLTECIKNRKHDGGFYCLPNPASLFLSRFSNLKTSQTLSRIRNKKKDTSFGCRTYDNCDESHSYK